MTLGRLLKAVGLAGLTAAAALGGSSFAAEPMDCAIISFNTNGNVAAAGGARLERGVSANPGMRGTITLPHEGALTVTGVWEDRAAVLFIGAHQQVFSGREYAGRPGTGNRILAGRLDGRPVFFSCDPVSGSAPAPAPAPAPRPVEDGAWLSLTVPFQSAIDLDAGRVDRLDGSSQFPEAEFILAFLRTPGLLVPSAVRIGSPADGSGPLEERCRAASESGDWTRQRSVSLDAAALGTVICVETTEGAFGAIRIDRVGEAEAGFSYHIFGRGGRG